MDIPLYLTSTPWDFSGLRLRITYIAHVVFGPAVADVCALAEAVCVRVLWTGVLLELAAAAGRNESYTRGPPFWQPRGPPNRTGPTLGALVPKRGPESGTQNRREGVSTDSRWTHPPGDFASHFSVRKSGPLSVRKKDRAKNDQDSGDPVATLCSSRKLLQASLIGSPEVLSGRVWHPQRSSESQACI